MQHDVALIPGQMAKMRSEIDVEFSKQHDEIEAIKSNIGKIFSEISDINKKTQEEQDRLKKAALEEMNPHVEVDALYSVLWE